MTGEKLAQAFEAFLARADGYILGLNNELYTAARAERLKRQDKAYYSRGDKWIGRFCSDCSGGIVGALRTEDPAYGDRRADTFAAQFVGGKKLINTLPEARGVAVWKKGHIGIYVGGGWAVEFRGIDYGCVKTKVAQRPWTHWGYVAGVDYSEAASVTYPRQMTVCTRLSPLNLRNAPQTGEIIAKMPKGAAVWALEEKDGWVSCVYYENGRFAHGWASKEYLI